MATHSNRILSGWLFAGTAAVVSVTACGGKKADVGGGAGGAAEGDDWSAVALKVQDIDVKGAAFTVTLPDGMARDPDWPGTSYIVPKADNFSLPKFRFELGACDAEAAGMQLKMGSTQAKPLTVAKQGEVAGGYAITAHTADKGTLWYFACKPLGAKLAIQCTGSQAKTGGVPNADATLAMFEKVCMQGCRDQALIAR